MAKVGSSNVGFSESPASSSQSTPRYMFRKRQPLPLPLNGESSDESDFFGDDPLDEEWALSDRLIEMESNKKSLIDVEELSSDEDCADDDSVVNGFVTLPKKKMTMSKSRKPTDKENLVEQTEQDIIDELEWKEGDLIEAVRPLHLVPPPGDVLGSPIEYFEYFFDDNFIENVTNFTNTYSTWKSKGVKCLNVSSEEMKQFLGIWIYMGVVKLPGIRDYWATETHIPQVSKVMTFNRFVAIRSSLHFYNKTEEESLNPEDRYRKVSFLLNHMKEKCNNLEQEDTFAIDETMVPYKGTFAGNLRQYIVSKPHKFGFKIFSLAGKSGIIYDFLPYAGSSTFREANFTTEEKEMGLGAQVVIHLTKAIDRPEQATLFFDNYFSSITLMRHLKNEYDILATGTIRSNRIDKCPLMSDQELKRQGRGTYDSKIKDNVQVIKWLDSKVVHIASSLAGINPEGKASRYDRTSKKRLDVPIPRAVELYNVSMGGVDLSDMLVELYRLPTRSRRWYVALIGYMIVLAIVNAWLIYRRHGVSLKVATPLASKQFRLAICKSLQGSRRQQVTPNARIKKIVLENPRGYKPDESVQHDGKDHRISYVEKRGRCAHCRNGITSVVCIKCNVYLCFVGDRNCFDASHYTK